MHFRHFRTDHTALVYTLTVGLVVPLLALAWLSAILDTAPATDEHRSTVAESAAPATARTPLPSEIHSEWVAQSGPAVILVGGTAEFRMVFRNTGSVAWTKGSPSEVRLGIVGDDPTLGESGYAVEWPMPTRVAAQEERVVPPGAQATFTFRVHGVSPGIVVIRVRPVMDGVAWLEDEGAHVELVVGAMSLRAIAGR